MQQTKPYTQKQLDKAEARAKRVAKKYGTSAKIGESGRCTMRIPQEAYFNAIQTEGGVIDGKTVWTANDDYRKDMVKRHPFLEVKPAGSESRVGPMLGRHGENFTDVFGKGKFDDVEAQHGAMFSAAKELVAR